LAAVPWHSQLPACLAEQPREAATTTLFEWERGIAIESPKQKGMAIFLWFYEWNMFEAVHAGEHTNGTFKLPRRMNAERTQATVGSDDLRLTISCTDDGADLLLNVTNTSDHDWPALAAIIPCLSPGRAGPKLDVEPPGCDSTGVNGRCAHWRDEGALPPRNPAFANESTYLLGTDGLARLNRREIHFNHKLRQDIDAAAHDGRFVFSDKWPTAEPDATAGLIVRESIDGKWVTGIGWEDFLSVQAHNPWQCMHLSPRVGPLERNASRRVRGKVYLFEGTKEQCAERYVTDSRRWSA
jgi:hypothetical protein